MIIRMEYRNPVLIALDLCREICADMEVALEQRDYEKALELSRRQLEASLELRTAARFHTRS